jgi:hypothetical protein
MRNGWIAILCLLGLAALLWIGPRRELSPDPAAPQAASAGIVKDSEPAVSAWLSDFADGSLRPGQGQPWQVSTDARRGGSSSATLAGLVEPDSDGFLRVQGEVAIGAAYPWSGAIWMPGESPMAAVDASSHRTLRLRLRGDGRPLMLMLLSGDAGSLPQMRRLETSTAWQEHRLPLTDFHGADLGRLRAVVVAASLPSGPYQFDIDALDIQ